MAKAGNEQADFEEEIVTKIGMDVIDSHFTDNKTCSEEEMQTISMRIIDDILKDLLKLKKSFKYAVTVFIGQKYGTAMNHSISTIMEAESDGMCVLTSENHYFDLIITIVGTKIKN